MSSPGFRSFSPAVRWYFATTAVNFIGSGMLFAFIFVYLDDVRGLTSGRAGLAVGATPITLVFITPLAGFLSDRFGARRTSSGYQRMAINLGAAVGAAIGGFLVDVDDVASFHRLFIINVVTYCVFLTCLPWLPTGHVHRTAEQRTSDGGFRAVLSDRFYLGLLVSDLGVAFSFGFLFGVMPPYAKKIGLSESTIGVLFGLGAMVVLITQLPTLKWVRGRRRMRCLALMNGCFFLGFVATSFSVGVSTQMAIGLIVLGQTFGGFGEGFLGAIRQPLTSDLAPDALVGRYFGLGAMVFRGRWAWLPLSGDH